MRVKTDNLRSKGLTLNSTAGSSKRGEFIFPLQGDSEGLPLSMRIYPSEIV